ncbi:MAG TPA: galactosyldiacylglycerol synthase [Opitutus sp.]|nr:galactosyldiacylglycerol synthase [Opitutus sp.]
MSSRILILTAGFGEGHNAAARALAAGFARTAGPGAAEIVDAFALASPRLNALSRRIYLSLINDTPKLWSRLYEWIDRTSFIQRRLWLFRREIRVLDELLARQRYDAICCTYPLYGYFLETIARRSVAVGAAAPSPRTLPPFFNIVTDSISIHSLWWRAPAAGWFLPNDDSAVVLRRAGIDPSLLKVRGFPVPAFFAENAATLSPPDLAANASPRVLHIINSGTRHAAATARRLLVETGWEITCAVGRDEKLRRSLARLAAARPQPATIIGWTDQVPRLLMTHHVVVSKAGGATTQEAIAALCPMIVSQVVPGQEEGNFELLRRHGAGALAETPDDVLAALRRAFADRGHLWRDWRAALRPLARPDAADDIARDVLAAIAGSVAAVHDRRSPGQNLRSPGPALVPSIPGPGE